MQSTLAASAHVGLGIAARTTTSNVFQSIFSGMVAGQEARARAIVRQHLLKYDDAQLEQLGWSKAEITDLRAQR